MIKKEIKNTKKENEFYELSLFEYKVINNTELNMKLINDYKVIPNKTKEKILEIIKNEERCSGNGRKYDYKNFNNYNIVTAVRLSIHFSNYIYIIQKIN